MKRPAEPVRGRLAIQDDSAGGLESCLRRHIKNPKQRVAALTGQPKGLQRAKGVSSRCREVWTSRLGRSPVVVVPPLFFVVVVVPPLFIVPPPLLYTPRNPKPVL